MGLNVHELIGRLEQLPPSAEVYMHYQTFGDSDYPTTGAKPVEDVQLLPDGIVKLE